MTSRRQQLLSLADELERAEKPTPQLFKRFTSLVARDKEHAALISDFWDVEAYLDACQAAMPEGWSYEIRRSIYGGTAIAKLWDPEHKFQSETEGKNKHGDAALAWSAANVRAVAAECE